MDADSKWVANDHSTDGCWQGCTVLGCRFSSWVYKPWKCKTRSKRNLCYIRRLYLHIHTRNNRAPAHTHSHCHTNCCRRTAYLCLHKCITVNYKESCQLLAVHTRQAITSMHGATKADSKIKYYQYFTHTETHTCVNAHAHARMHGSQRSGCHCDWFLLPRANPQ